MKNRFGRLDLNRLKELSFSSQIILNFPMNHLITQRLSKFTIIKIRLNLKNYPLIRMSKSINYTIDFIAMNYTDFIHI